jgi:hypothetical protein
LHIGLHGRKTFSLKIKEVNWLGVLEAVVLRELFVKMGLEKITQ